MSRQPDPCTVRTPRVYWLLGGFLVAYVAVCTPGRDNMWGTDGWEHHRALKALTDDLWHPGNPSYLIDTPSARYTPYSVFWAMISRNRPRSLRCAEPGRHCEHGGAGARGAVPAGEVRGGAELCGGAGGDGEPLWRQAGDVEFVCSR